MRASRTALLTLVVIALGCTGRQLGLSRTALSVAAPDGSAWAEVRDHPNIDPPSQSLWLRYRSGETLRLRRLADDQDWCDSAVWASDSSRVVFLVQGVQALLYDLATRQLLATDLIARGGAYPPQSTARDLAFSADGNSLTFRSCSRQTSACGKPQSLPVPTATASTLGQWRRAG